MAKVNPQSPEFIPTNSNFTPKSSSLIKLSVRYAFFVSFFFNKSFYKPTVAVKVHKERKFFKKKVRLALRWKERRVKLPASRLGLCLNPNRCIYHSLYSCIIGGRGVQKGTDPESSQYFSLIIRKGEEGKFFLWVFFCLFVFVFLAPEKAGKEQ